MVHAARKSKILSAIASYRLALRSMSSPPAFLAACHGMKRARARPHAERLRARGVGRTLANTM